MSGDRRTGDDGRGVSLERLEDAPDLLALADWVLTKHGGTRPGKIMGRWYRIYSYAHEAAEAQHVPPPSGDGGTC